MLFVLAFAFVITICGTAAAATPQQNTTINSHNNSSTLSTLQTNSKVKKTVSKGDPIINGTVTINEYGVIRNLSNATVTVNSTSGRILATGTTNANGYYSINFYSTDTQFKITTSYLGCNPVTNTVTVKLSSNPGDPNYYGTSNCTLTPKQAWWNGNFGSGSNIYITHYNGYYFAGEIVTAVDGTSTTYTSYCIDIYTNIWAGDKLLINGPLPGTAGNLSDKVDWGAVNYIINHYSPSSPGSGLDSNQEGAAIQSAIWALTTVQYPDYNPSNPSAYYHFLTAPNDANDQNGGTAIRTRALAIASYAAAHSMVYPSSIIVSPKITRIANGQPVTITATVYDNQGNPLPNTTVNFQTTSGTLSSSTRVTNSNGQVVITLSNVPYSSSVTVTASVSGNYGNLLYDDPLNPRQNLAAKDILPLTISDISIINSDITANVDLSQTKNSPVNVGDKVTYTVTAKNNGSNDATGIMITDIVPAGLTGITVTNSTGSYYNGVWVIPTLAIGDTTTLTITGTATASMAGLKTTNTATRTAQDQYNPLPAVSAADVYTNKADLTITNTGTTPINVGDTGTFTINITNNGPDPATNINIHDIRPSGFTADTSGIGIYDGTTWTINSLASGATATLTFTKNNIPASMAGTNTTNTATATWNEYPKTVTIPNSTIYVKQANVTLSQIGNYSGNTVTFIVTATNNGPDTATNINIKDLIPTGLTGANVIPSIGTYNSITGVWTVPSLNYLASATLNITGTGVPQGTVTNNATITGQTEYNSQLTTISKSVYIPQVNIYAENYPWWWNSDIQTSQYTYVVGNAPPITVDIWNLGPDDATGVIYTYTIGKGLKYEGYSADTGTVTYANNQLTWNIGNIANGGDTILKVFVRVMESGNQTSDVSTTANLIHVDQAQSDTSYNNATCALIVPKAADISVTQTQTTYTDTDGNTYVTYTITATNNGPDNATNVQITDKLPTGTTYNSSTPPTGTTYTNTNGLWNIGNINNGETKTLTITAKITTTTGTIKNTTTKTKETEYDPNYTNNSQTTNIIRSGSYTPTVDLYAENYPWWWNSDIQTSQYTYVVGNAPPITVDIWNLGPDDATGVIYTYTIGKGLKYEGYSADTGTVTYANNQLTWNIGNIANGGDTILKVFVRVMESGNQTSDVSTTANLIHVDQAQSDTSYNNATCALIVPKAADISVTQTQTTYTDTDGNTYVTYTITATNNGPDNATNVQITDKLPTGTTYNSSTPPTGTTYTNTNGLWNIGNINNGETKTLTITAKITTTTGTIKNTTTKTKETEYDPNYTNNSQTSILILN